MAIIAKFTRTLPAPTSTHSGGFVFLLSTGWFTQANTGAAGSPINGVNSLADGGGDMQIFSDASTTTRLPIEVVAFATGGTPSAQVWVRTPTYAAGDTITIGKDNAQTVQPSVSAPFGRNAVYVDEINRMHMESITPIDSTGNQAAIIANAVTSEPGNIGNALRFNGSSSDIDLGDSILPVGDFTQNIWINPDDLSGFQGIIGNWVSPEDGRSYIGLNGTSYNWDGYSTSSNNRGTATALVWQMLTVTRTGLTVTILSNGAQQGTTIVDNGTPNVLHNTFIGALTEGTSNFYDGLIGDNFLSNTYRNNDYMLDLFTNQSDPDNFGTSSEYILVGGSGITLTVDSGSYNLTGTNISLKASFKSAIDSGVYSFSGKATNLIVDSKVIAESGSYAITGGSADLVAARKSIIESGSYNLTGSSVGLIYTPASGGEVLVVDSGSFSLAGADVGLIVNRRTAIESGNYNLTGQSIQLTYNSNIVASSGTYALTGQDISLFTSYVTMVASGSYNLTGYPVTLKYSGDTSQTIGTVTTSFADDQFTASYKPNSITVTFKA